MGKKKLIKKKVKFFSAYVILFMIIVFVSALTWIIPAGEYQKDKSGNYISGTYKRIQNLPQGLWDIALAPIYGMVGKGDTPAAINISLFILVLGGFLGIMEKTGAISSGVSSLLKKNRGKEKHLILLLMIFFAIGGTTYGMAEETLVFYPILIPFLLSAGFDTMTAVGVILLGAGAGVLGSTVNPFATGVASEAAKIGLGEGIGWRLLVLCVSFGITILYVLRYASKVQKDHKYSYVVDQREEDLQYFKIPENTKLLTRKQKVALFFFAMTFFIMIVSLVPWSSIISKFTFFENSLNTILKIPFLGPFLGRQALSFGNWYLNEITALFMVMAIILGIMYRFKEDDIIQSFIKGASSLLGVAFIVGLARGIQVVMNDGKITATILYWSENILRNMPKSLFGIITYNIYIGLSFLIPSTSGLASATISIVSSVADFIEVKKHVVITAFQAASGIVNLFTPTSAVVMGSLAIAHVPYQKWLLFILKLLVTLFIVNMIIIGLAAALS